MPSRTHPDARKNGRIGKITVFCLHCLWGLPQALVGAVLLLFCCRCPHSCFRGCIVTHWKCPGCTAIGPFIFLEPDAGMPLLLHEYGHCLQSARLGALYLPAVYLPSLLWFHLPACKRLRKRRAISYYRFYTEAWANRLAYRRTGMRPDGFFSAARDV